MAFLAIQGKQQKPKQNILHIYINYIAHIFLKYSLKIKSAVEFLPSNWKSVCLFFLSGFSFKDSNDSQDSKGPRFYSTKNEVSH